MNKLNTYELIFSAEEIRLLKSFNYVNVQSVFDFLYNDLFSNKQRLEHLSFKINGIRNAGRFWDINRKQNYKFYNFIKSKLENQQTEKFDISSSQELQKYIYSLLEDELEFRIRQKQKYFNYWEDNDLTIPKRENHIQQDIENTLDPFCEKVGIHREPLSGNGKIDFLFEYFGNKVCLEVKLADHSQITTAAKTQLTQYLKSKNTEYGIYLVFWHKNQKYDLPKKFMIIKDLEKEISNNLPENYNIRVKIIDCTKPISPSLL